MKLVKKLKRGFKCGGLGEVKKSGKKLGNEIEVDYF